MKAEGDESTSRRIDVEGHGARVLGTVDLSL